MIPYGHQSISTQDIKAVISVLQSAYLTQGPQVEHFEKALADYCGARYAVATCNGTAALHLAYLAAGLKPGDEVITAPNTFVATTNMLLAVGAKPVFCDIRLDTYNIDETKIEKLITKKTKAIVPVHFAGHPCETDKIRKVARRHRLLVVEDACHALGACYRNSVIGDCRYSDMAVFSFHPVKSITTGEGGAILTNNVKFYKKLLLLRNHGIIKNKNGFNVMKTFGYNHRLTDIQAALGISQLKRLDDFLQKRRKIIEEYNRQLGRVKEIILPGEQKQIKSSWHLYVVRVKDPKKRLTLAKYLKTKGIATNFHYPAVYVHPFYRRLGYGSRNLKNMEEYQKTCLTIPCFPDLSHKEVRYICSKIQEFFKRI